MSTLMLMLSVLEIMVLTALFLILAVIVSIPTRHIVMWLVKHNMKW